MLYVYMIPRVKGQFINDQQNGYFYDINEMYGGFVGH